MTLVEPSSVYINRFLSQKIDTCSSMCFLRCIFVPLLKDSCVFAGPTRPSCHSAESTPKAQPASETTDQGKRSQNHGQHPLRGELQSSYLKFFPPLKVIVT